MKLAAALATLPLATAVVAAKGETKPPAPALAPDFRIVGNQSLPGRCASSLVAPRMAAVLGAFNAGHATRFARHFVAAGDFEPYNGRPNGGYRARGRAAIASVVRTRHRKGDGWTAFQLDGPVSASSGGIFGLSLRVSADGNAFEQGVKVVISCRTGRIRIWRGPAWPPATAGSSGPR
jgi:hypothetical protein